MTDPAANQAARILIVDDNRSIHEDFRKILCAEAPSALDDLEAALFDDATPVHPSIAYRLDSAYQGQEGLRMVEAALAAGDPYKVAFVDIRMPPGWDGVETITHLWKVDPELQVVISTAFSDYTWEEIGSRLDRPAQLLILKKPFDVVEVRQLAMALSEKWALSRAAKLQMSRLEEQVRERTSRLEHSLAMTNATLEATGDGILVVDLNGRILVHNQVFAELFDISPEILSQRVDENCLHHVTGRMREPEAFHAQVRRYYERPEATGADIIETTSGVVIDRRTRPYLLGDRIVGRIWSFRDITEHRRLEQQLLQSQKIEAIGQLAGGIAHDFNNLLTVINGHAEMVIHEVREEGHVRRSIGEILAAGERAAALTRQLLAFSRKQVLMARSVDLNELMIETERMLRRLIAEDIVYELTPAADLWSVRVDPNQMVQVIMNLVVNARDAMPCGGRLEIATANLKLTDPVRCESLGLKPGPYVTVSVRDTGCGFDDAVRQRIFEPFFTTKPQGRGTGLGLSTVYGIIHQSHGAIEVDSQPGQGTTFTLFVPALLEAPPVPEDQPDAPRPFNGAGRVLIVEDEDAVRKLARRILDGQGLHVHEAHDAQTALRLLEDHAPIDLVITDVVMPGSSGLALARHIRERWPQTRILFISGYPDETIDLYGPDESEAPLLAKPFTPEALLLQVRTQLATAHHP